MDQPALRSARPRTGKREATKAQNRALILDAARRVFREQGYDPVTVRDIIGATGLASGTFYNYYKSKEEVFQALRDASALKVRPLLREARRSASSAEEFVRGNFRTFFEFMARERAEEGARGGTVPRMRLDTPEVVVGFNELREDIEAAISVKLMPPMDAAYLAAAMIGIAFEVAQVTLERNPQDIDGATSFATQLVMTGLTVSPYQPV